MKQQKFKKYRYFHFTTKFVHPKWYDQHLSRNWIDLLSTLEAVQHQRQDPGLTWHSGVLLSNHVHLLFSTDSYNEHSLVLDIETQWKKQLEIKKPLFQRPLPCEPLEHFEHFKMAYKYIYRNPVEAGLCLRAEDYKYSSLGLILDRFQPAHRNPFIDPLEIIHNPLSRLRWINKDDNDRQMNFFEFGEGV